MLCNRKPDLSLNLPVQLYAGFHSKDSRPPDGPLLLLGSHEPLVTIVVVPEINENN